MGLPQGPPGGNLLEGSSRPAGDLQVVSAGACGVPCLDRGLATPVQTGHTAGPWMASFQTPGGRLEGHQTRV
eukprot:NODE_9852_length_459_cov_3.397561_g8754_i0.p3 GENE.NODE_9852_length_459_cov_3.397561_g8754_i0~~NODE_9852_length_459_cov_3.397561_g8754_i0.p3  ORF type:complete len:72 (+),score=0.50 NODE_9852_length_459_cov_3.397561_g8754_i0:134-349(+)